MHVSLVVPAPFSQVSGGYAYDRWMVAGLRDDGHSVTVVELLGRFPLCDETARDSACAAWDRLADGTRVVIDGLALPGFAGMQDALGARGTIGLIHHPTALETGLAEAERTWLQDTEQQLFRHLHRLIVTSDSTAERLAKEFGVDPQRIAVVMPGTRPAARSPGSGGPGCEILSIGTLVPRKGYEVLLRALARLFDLDWHLTIVGSPAHDPDHARALTALADELRVADRVCFAGEVSDQALEALWHRTDLFALATWFEGYGMAIAEALRRGVPVAVTAGGAAAGLVTPEAGLVCQPGETDQLSKALRRAIFCTDLRHEMADAAWRIGQTLPDWDAQARAFAQAIG